MNMVSNRINSTTTSFLTEQIIDIVSTRALHTPMTLQEAARMALRLHGAMLPPAQAPEEFVQITAGRLKPAVPIKDSIQQEYLVCLETGKRFKMLRRHLKESLGLTPEDYRSKWGLPVDYPMTAPGYSQAKSQAAKRNQLGLHQRN